MPFIPLIDVVLNKPEDIKARLKVAEFADKTLGFKSFGFEFIFFNAKDFSNLSTLEKRAKNCVQELKKMNFSSIMFSLHAPFIETPRLEEKEFDYKFFFNLNEFGKDFISTINFHPTPSFPPTLFEKKIFSFKDKKEKLLNLKLNLEKIEEISSKFSIENLELQEKNNENQSLGIFPYEFLFLLEENKNISLTLDICHAGITFEHCSKIKEKQDLKNFEGVFKEEFNEIQMFTAMQEFSFQPLFNRIEHIHLSNYSKNLKPGKALSKGVKNENFYIQILKEIKEKTNDSIIGCVLEVWEKDFQKNPETIQALKDLKKILEKIN
jgi:hypothetical protein